MEQQQTSAKTSASAKANPAVASDLLESKANPTAASDSPARADYDEITYLPSDGDPDRVIWNGIAFQKKEAVKVPRNKVVLVPIREKHTLIDGSVVWQSVETKIPMVELARENPYFMINGAPPKVRKNVFARNPTDADEYRGYAIHWIARSTSASAMMARWEHEISLREKCGVNDRDLEWLSSSFDSQYGQLGGKFEPDERAWRKRWARLTAEEHFTY